MINESKTIGGSSNILVNSFISNVINQPLDKLIDKSEEDGYTSCKPIIMNMLATGLQLAINDFCTTNHIEKVSLKFDKDSNNSSMGINSRILKLDIKAIRILMAVVDIISKNLESTCHTFFSDHYTEDSNSPKQVKKQIKNSLLEQCHRILIPLYSVLVHELSHAAVDKGVLKGRQYSTPPAKDTAEYEVWVKKYKEDPAEIDAYANQYVGSYILQNKKVSPTDIKELMAWAVTSHKLEKDSDAYKKFAKAVYKAFHSHFNLAK